MSEDIDTGDDESAVVVVCAGPPLCLLEGEEAIAQQIEGCPTCRRDELQPDGSWKSYHKAAN